MKNSIVVTGFDSADSAQDAVNLFNKCSSDCWIEEGDWEIKKERSDVGILHVLNIFDSRQSVPFWHFAWHNDFVRNMIKEGRKLCHGSQK